VKRSWFLRERKREREREPSQREVVKKWEMMRCHLGARSWRERKKNRDDNILSWNLQNVLSILEENSEINRMNRIYSIE